jgi:ADP-ribosylglycohydrolase
MNNTTKEEAMVGGDNASRAIAIGMVLGAYRGVNAIPKEWKETLDQWEYCENLLNTLLLLTMKDGI